MKFEGKTFYLYVSQKEVSASPSRGTSRARPWQVLRALGRCHPVLGARGRGGSAGVTPGAASGCWSHRHRVSPGRTAVGALPPAFGIVVVICYHRLVSPAQ